MNNIKKYRSLQGFTMQSLADFVGTTSSQINKLEKGTVNLTAEWCERLAPYLKVQPGKLLRNIDLNIEGEIAAYQAPLISFVQAGDFTACMDPYEKGDYAEMVNTSHPKPTILALKVKGESMNLVAPNGSTIIVDYCDKELVDGKFYVVRINGDDETTFKQYRANPTRFEAYSNIQGFETIFPREGMEVIGLVVEVLNRLYEK